MLTTKDRIAVGVTIGLVILTGILIWVARLLEAGTPINYNLIFVSFLLTMPFMMAYKGNSINYWNKALGVIILYLIVLALDSLLFRYLNR